jgi:hypothetical protein
MLFTTESIFYLFDDFTTLKVWEQETVLNEGPFHQGSASVIRGVRTK